MGMARAFLRRIVSKNVVFTHVEGLVPSGQYSDFLSFSIALGAINQRNTHGGIFPKFSN